MGNWTTTDRIISEIKNHPVLSVVIASSIVLGGIASTLTSIDQIWTFVEKRLSSPTKDEADLATPKLLSEKDLKGKDAFELDIMRNEPFARYGRYFCRKDLQDYFQDQDWYEPEYCPEEFKTRVLSPIENANVDRIEEFQRARGLTGPKATQKDCYENLKTECYKDKDSE